MFFPIISLLGVAFVLGGAYIDLEIINLTNEKGYFTMTTYPYNVSGDAHLIKIIEKLQNVFPKEISVETIKKYGIANKVELYIIKTLKFINLIDESGNAVPESKTLFKKMGKDFQIGFAEVINKAYAELFEIHGENAWNLENDELTPFFKGVDDVSIKTAQRQGQTFKVFAEFAGKREPQSNRTAQIKSPASTKSNTIKKEPPESNIPKSNVPQSNSPKPATVPLSVGQDQLKPSGNFALSVRIEVNLPSDGTKETYDNIFKSIRENLINE